MYKYHERYIDRLKQELTNNPKKYTAQDIERKKAFIEHLEQMQKQARTPRKRTQTQITMLKAQLDLIIKMST